MTRPTASCPSTSPAPHHRAGRRRLLLLLALGALVACTPPSPPVPTDRYVFLDRSSSVSEESRGRWLEELVRVVRTMGPADRLVVYGIHNRTDSAPPIAEVELPAAPGEGMTEQARFQAARRKLQTEVSARARAFFGGAPALETDVLGAFSRLPASERRQRQLVFMSDMRHSTRAEAGFDMERVPLTSRTMDGLVAAAARRYRWHADLLRDVEVRCYLDSPEVSLTRAPSPGETPIPGASGGRARTVNDRETLRLFWTSLVRALGGNLTHFDNTHFTPNEAPRGDLRTEAPREVDTARALERIRGLL
jgi:hypothetical protein